MTDQTDIETNPEKVLIKIIFAWKTRESTRDLV